MSATKTNMGLPGRVPPRKRIISIILPFLSLPFYIWVFITGEQIHDTAGIFLVMFIGGQLLYLVALVLMKRFEVSLIAIIVSAAVSLLLLLPGRPTISTDLYRYIWDGRVTSSGYNVFVVRPNELKELQTKDSLYDYMNYREEYTIYPPLAQLIFTAVNSAYETVGYWGAKLIVAVPFFVASGLLWAKLRGKNRRWYFAAFVLNPLLLFELFSSAHIDGWALLFIALAYYAYKKGFFVKAALCIALAALVKLWPLLLFPALGAALLRQYPLRIAVHKMVLSGLSVGALLIVAYAPFVQTSWLALTRLGSWAADMNFNSLFYAVGGMQQELVQPLSIVLLAVGVCLAALKLPLLHAWSAALIVFVLLSPVFYPWYLIPLLLLIVLSRVRAKVYALALFLIAASLSYVQQIDALSNAQHQSLLNITLILEGLAAVALLGLLVRPAAPTANIIEPKNHVKPIFKPKS